MKTALVTGCFGLVGSEVSKELSADGFDVYGVDNDTRSFLFPEIGKLTDYDKNSLMSKCGILENYSIDISDTRKVEFLFSESLPRSPDIVVHCAAQPSHDWAAKDPLLDFRINALGTLGICEAVRRHCPDAKLIYLSTNKVYGDMPNTLPTEDLVTRYDLPTNHLYYQGIPEHFQVDHCLHSLFGCSKLAGDIYVQEYARYFGLKTVVLRGGCLTGAAHRGAKLHGFLSYLVKSALNKEMYEIIGYKGLQVRDNLHANDIGKLVLMIHSHVWRQTDYQNCVYNLGGGRSNAVSILEVVEMLRESFGLNLSLNFNPTPRIGDHKWYISDVSRLSSVFGWSPSLSILDILNEIVSYA